MCGIVGYLGKKQVVPVIIAEGKDSDGLYFYSTNEEACLRLVPLEI